MPDNITKMFPGLLRRSGLRHFHYYASIMLANNVPDKYAMKRMGHATNSMLKNVYQHIITQKDQEVTVVMNNFFSGHFQ